MRKPLALHLPLSRTIFPRTALQRARARARTPIPKPCTASLYTQHAPAALTRQTRTLTSCSRLHDDTNPTAAQAHATEPSPLSIEEYHERSEEYIEILQDRLEALQESVGDIDVEYSAGVLTTITPRGTYVLNKQPPNRQIWLSSPVSGPKRYDWVAVDGDDSEGEGHWVYLRDGSRLSDLLRDEVGVDMALAFEQGV